MPLLNEPEPPPRSSRRGWLYTLVLLVLAGGGYYLYVSGLLTPSEDAERRAAVEAPSPSRPGPAAAAPTEPEPAEALALAGVLSLSSLGGVAKVLITIPAMRCARATEPPLTLISVLPSSFQR